MELYRQFGPGLRYALHTIRRCGCFVLRWSQGWIRRQGDDDLGELLDVWKAWRGGFCVPEKRNAGRIVGEVNLREYQDKEGQKRYSLDVRVNDLTLLGGKKAEDDDPHQYGAPKQQQNPRNAQGAPKASFEDDDDTNPFAPHGAGRAWRVI